MLISIFAATLFVIGVFSINGELRHLLTPIGVGGVITSNIVLAMGHSSAVPEIADTWLLKLLISFVSGVFAGAPLAVMIHAVTIYGRMIDLSAGLLIAEQLQLGMQERQSPSQTVMVLGAATLIFSPELFPLFGGGLIAPNFTSAIPNFDLNEIIAAVGKSIECGLLLALPVVVFLLVLELGVALFGKFLQPINIGAELPPTKLLLVVLYLTFFAASSTNKAVTNFISLYRESAPHYVKR